MLRVDTIWNNKLSSWYEHSLVLNFMHACMYVWCTCYKRLNVQVVKCKFSDIIERVLFEVDVFNIF